MNESVLYHPIRDIGAFVFSAVFKDDDTKNKNEE